MDILYEKLIEDRIDNFLGYGNLDGKTWFIGMEEGSSDKFEELFERFNKTFNKEIIDLRDLDIPMHMKFFKGDLPPIQRTLNRLILILMIMENLDYTSLEKRKLYQRNQLGCVNGNHCLLELSSLPSTSISTWVYSDYCKEVNYLISRKNYITQILPKRIKLIADKIILHKPEKIIFYSKTYTKYWNEIINLVNDKHINFYIIPHPTARGLKKEDWDNVFKKFK